MSTTATPTPLSNDWFNKNAELSSGLPNIPGKYIRNTYGADLGGPIKKQKLFFFGNYEASHIRENTQVQREIPTASLRPATSFTRATASTSHRPRGCG